MKSKKIIPLSSKHLTWIAVFVVVIVAVVVLSNKRANDSVPVAIPQSDTRTLVETEYLHPQPIMSEVKIFGQTLADKKIPVKSRTTGTVKKTYVQKGQFVKKGDVLIELSMDDRAAKLSAAKAAIEENKIIYKTTQTLVKEKFDSEAALIQAEAGLKAARSNLDSIKKDISYTKIKAPFDGIFDKRMVEVGDFVDHNMAIGTLISLNPIKISADIPEQYITRVQDKAVAKVKLLSGQIFDATLTYVSSIAETNTRTFKIELESDNPDNKIAEGLTVEVTLPLETQSAHKISTLSSLTLNEVGTIGIKTVQDGTVHFYKVDVIREDADGFWIAGLPNEDIHVISTGQEYVKTGEVVRTKEKNKDQ